MLLDQLHAAAGRRCDRQATQNCTLPSDVIDPPAWTNMRPGQCVLQYLREAQRGFSNSPRLNGNRNRTGPDLNYWTGTRIRLPDDQRPGPLCSTACAGGDRICISVRLSRRAAGLARSTSLSEGCSQT